MVGFAVISCGKKKDDRDPYPFEVEDACYKQELTYLADKNSCGEKSKYGLLDAGVQNNFLECKGYLDIPNPGAYCNIKETEIVAIQPTVKKITIRYSYIADLSKDPPIGKTSVHSDLMPKPVLVSDNDNVERSFVQVKHSDIFGPTKFEGYTMTVTGTGPFKIFDLEAPKAPGYWLESSSGLAIHEIKIEQP